MNDEQVSADTIQFPARESNEPPKRRRRVVSRHYFIAFQGKLFGMPNDVMEGHWTNEEPISGLSGYFRVMSVVFDETSGIAGCYFMLLAVANGIITTGSIEAVNNLRAKQAQETIQATGCLLPGYVEQRADWPKDWRQQVAQKLGIAPVHVHDMGIGGPLITSYTKHYSIAKSARIHAEALRLKAAI